MWIHSSRHKNKYLYKGRLPFKKFVEIIKEASKYHCPSLTIGGTSEPLLDERTADMLSVALEYGFVDTMINTNATLLTPKIAKGLIKSGLGRLRIGFDGATAETYEKIRKGANFNIVKNNIINFIKLRNSMNSLLPVVRISCVHLSENDAEINEFVKFWRPIVDYVSIQRYRPHDFSKERSREHLGAGKKTIRNLRCSQPFERLYIRGDGDVHACCSIVYGPKVGNVFKSSLYDIWNSKRMKNIRKALKTGRLENLPTCRMCISKTFG